MSFSDDKEMLHDFLVEAGEILEKLSAQLVELERTPDNIELLNAIFRGFHTVKGGAGFLQVEPLVECCHKTENLFDILRNQKRVVDAALMDVTLQALDAINTMFVSLQEGQAPASAPASVLQALDALVASANTPSPILDVPVKTETPALTAPEVSDSDFESFVSSLQTLPDSLSTEPTVALDKSDKSDKKEGMTSDEISDEEFEALLDALHDKEKMVPPPEPVIISQPRELSKSGAVTTETKKSDVITDDEFEALLDQLHGPKVEKKPAPGTPVKSPVEKITNEKPPIQNKIVAKPAAIAAVDEHKDDDDHHKNPDHKSSVPGSENTVRVDTQRLDDIMNMVGELVLVRNRLVRLGSASSDEELSKTIANLDVVTGDLQSSVMKTRMQPIKKVFGRFPRVVRDLARSMQKEVTLILEGEETDLDKNLVEALADPLVHLVRNAVDHGIELPLLREAAGKSRQGVITLSAAQEGDHILLTIKDDGAGMDPEKLRALAIKKGLLSVDAANRLNEHECYELIFAPGFSTKTVVSDVSGRGVGMDVVKTKISQLNGLVTIRSTLGQGSCITIKVPLTLAIMPTLMVMLGKQIFALPLASVSEIFNLDLRSTNVVDGQEVITVRESTIPLFHLKRWLVNVKDNRISENSHVVVVSVGNQQIGFVVDQLIGQEEVVIKPLGKMLIGTPGVAGATITGDGRIALILDTPTLLEKYVGEDRSRYMTAMKQRLEKKNREANHAA